MEGVRVVNENGRPVRLIGINWSGFETSNKVPGGLDHQDYRVILDSIKRAGFNVIRIPFSNEMIEHPIVSTAIAFQVNGYGSNEDLRQLNSLEILDKVISYSGSIGLRVILDNHRSSAGGGPQENGLWFTDDYPETSWVDDWLALARRYRKQYTVIGFDLRNEPHSSGRDGGACWGCGKERDWHLAAERAGNLILAEDPSKLIIIEGVDVYENDASWWGGNLEGVEKQPVQLAIPNHVIYSAHEYGPLEHPQPWFNASTNPASLRALWSRRWGFIEDQGIAPIYIGEFGTVLTSQHDTTAGSQAQWFAAFADYLSTRPNVGWSYWAANAEDRYAFFQPGYLSERAGSSQIVPLFTNEKPIYSMSSDLASVQNREPVRITLCKSSDRKREEAGVCPADNLSATPRKNTADGLTPYILKNVDRATRRAMKGLPLEHP